MTEPTNCPDCGVAPGERHEENCDVALCPFCGQQDLMCTVPEDEKHEDGPFVCCDTDEPRVEGDMTTWTGRWPGEVECEELGWFAYFVPYGNPSWVSCDKDHPGAVHDMNRLAVARATGELAWDRDKQRFVRKDET